MKTTASLGILGAGQLAAMLTEASHRLGIDVHVYRASSSNDRCAPDALTTAPYDDAAALQAFAASVDVVTVETEDIPVETLRTLEQFVPVHPSSAVIEICQDRLLEKNFLTSNGIATAPYGAVNSAGELAAQIARCGERTILKTRRFGYDGKGQTRIGPGDDPIAKWEHHGESPSVLEQFVPFDFEISVVAARNEAGEIARYDPGRNEHRDGILRQTEIPARIEPELGAKAVEIANTIVEALDYVGVLAVEFFVVGSELLVNELAPRVHNSGHWTQQGCVVDQFEQHVRCITGYPLGHTARHCNVTMTNLIGADVESPALFHSGTSRVHLYGKREVRPGRKMGHINTVHPLG